MFFEVSAEVVIDGAVGGNGSQFINHSCAPTCVVDIEDGRVQIYAARDLQRGEELTFDYAYEWEPRFPVEMRDSHRCHCGAACCRGTIFVNAPPEA